MTSIAGKDGADRLCDATLSTLPQEVSHPAYDRARITSGVVHLGIGAFHRAHQAIVFDDCLAAGDGRWGITGVSMRSGDVRDALQPQDGLYTVAVRDGRDEALCVVGAVREVLVAPEDPAAVVDALASPDTHLVTLTVTEKGYKVDPASGDLLTGDADIAADLEDLSAPRTVPGLLAAGLARRRSEGLPPFTAISCDNLPNNGGRLRGAVLAMAAAHDPALAAWITTHGAFPQTMVDRIVPATDSSDIDRVTRAIGMVDKGTVKTEPFLQWVIEDRFAGPRPDFGTQGVTVTDDVRPWEEAKLRLLNGAHSAIAYLGGLSSIAFVHDFVALPEGRAFVEALWDEAASTLDPPEGLDIPGYREALMARFANPALHHRTLQIAKDGSQKLSQRLLAPIADRIVAGAPFDSLALAVASWMCWVCGESDQGGHHEIDDPRADEIAQALAGAEDVDARVDALLHILASDITGSRLLHGTIASACRDLSRYGSLSMLQRCRGAER